MAGPSPSLAPAWAGPGLEAATLSRHETIPKPCPSGYGLALRRDECLGGGGLGMVFPRLNTYKQIAVFWQKKAFSFDKTIAGR